MKFLILLLIIITISAVIIVKPLNERVVSLFPNRVSEKEENYIGTLVSNNPRVREIQRMLKTLKFYTGPMDGKMSKEVRNAIRTFQKKNSLNPTGRIDSKTLNELRKQTTVLSKDHKPSVKKVSTPQKISYDIKFIQSLLKNSKFYEGEVDGKMGPETVKAIKQFQKSRNLKQSGVINIKTWEELKKLEMGGKDVY